MSDFDEIKSTIDRVSDMIDEAISTNDYTDLSRQIGGLMRSATDAVQKTASSFAAGVNEAARQNDLRQGSSRRELDQSAQQRRAEARRKAKERADREAYEAQYFAKTEDATGPKILSVIGAAGAVVFGSLTLILGVFSSAIGGIAGGLTAPLAVVTGVITACGIAMLHFGRKASRKNQHFKAYKGVLMPHLYANISDISKETGIPEKKVISELKDFTAKKMIRQGHFDVKETCFIASDEIYEQYKAAEQRAEYERQKAEAAEQSVSPEVRELLAKGNEYIRMIHEANDRIPDEEVTAKLNRMEQITRRIFEEVEKKPSLAGSLNMFMNYYLPTTTKLVKAYEELDGQEIEGENIRTAKREIENSLDTISDAFEKILDSFFKEQAMDVSSDINVMKMMMKQEGLTEDDLTAMRKAQAAKEAAARRAAQAQAQAAQAQAQAAQTQAAQAQAQAAQTQAAEAQAVQTAAGTQAAEAQAVQTAAGTQMAQAQAVQTAAGTQAAQAQAVQTASGAQAQMQEME